MQNRPFHALNALFLNPHWGFLGVSCTRPSLVVLLVRCLACSSELTSSQTGFVRSQIEYAIKKGVEAVCMIFPRSCFSC